MISTKELHTWITQLIKKNFGGFVSPKDVDLAINTASKDLFNSLVKTYVETNKLPDLLKNFKEFKNQVVTAGVATLTGVSDIELISVQSIIATKEFDAVIARDDKEWTSRKMSDINPNPAEPNEVLSRNIITESFTEAEMVGGADLSDFFLRPVSVSIEIDGLGEFEGLLVDPTEFFSRQQLDLTEAKNEGKIKDYLQIEEIAFVVNPTNGFQFDIPQNYVQAMNIFRVDAQNNYYEGDILSEVEFAERMRSVLLAPTLEHPIARIVDQKIEFYPSLDGANDITYKLSFRAFPTLRRPLFKIEDNKLFLHPSLTLGGTDTINLTQYQHPVEKRCLVRYKTDGDDTVFDFLPKTVLSSNLNYLRNPIEASYGYTISNGDEVVDGVIVDMDWDLKAFQAISTGALMYLGYQVKDAETAQLITQRDQTEIQRTQL